MHYNRRHLLALVTAATATAALPRAVRAQAPAPSLETWARSPFIDQIAISPNAQKIAIVTQSGDHKVLQTVDRAASEPLTAHIGDVKVRDLFWSDNDNVVLVTSVVGELPIFGGFRHEVRQATIIAPKTGKGRMLWDREPDLATPIVAGELSRVKTADGYRVAAANYASFEKHCLALFPSDPDAPRKLGELTNQYKMGQIPCLALDNYDMVVGPDGRIVASCASDFESQRGKGNKPWSVLWNTKAEAGPPFMKEIFHTTYAIESPELHGLGADGNSLIISLFDDAIGWDYFTLTPDGQTTPLADPRRDSRDRLPLFHPLTRRFAGFARFGDFVAYDYLDPALATVAKSLPAAMGEGYRTRIVSFAEDPRQLIVHVAGDDEAGSYYFLDLAGGANTLLGTDYPQIDPSWLSPRTAIRYPAGDGLTIPAYLTLPVGRPAKNLPLVVMPHGGPEARDTLAFDWQAQALAARGYAVLQPNFRGSSGYGLTFLKAGYGQAGRRMQTDLSDGVRYLVANGTVDARRVAIYGASYGGYAALAGATLDPGVYNCAISVAGLSDLDLMFDDVRNHGDGDYAAGMLYWQRYFGDRSRLAEVSPIRHIDAVTVPILLIHGKDDTVVLYEQSVRMERALKKAGKDVEFISYAGQDHWETIESARIDMITRVAAFLDKHNPA